MTLTCAVVQPPPDWNAAALHGDLSPLSAALCQAIAIAAGATLAVQRFATEREALDALAAGGADLALGVTPNAADEAGGRVRFGATIFRDAIGIATNGPVASLDHRRLCLLDGTLAAAYAAAALARQGLRPLYFSFQEQGEMESGFRSGRCEAVAGALSALPGAPWPDRLAEIPAVLATRPDRPRLAAIADMTVAALLQAERTGLTQANIATAADNGDPDRRTLLGSDPSVGAALGLPGNWAVRVVAGVGNYGEILARTLPALASAPRPLAAPLR